jgi:histone H4
MARQKIRLTARARRRGQVPQGAGAPIYPASAKRKRGLARPLPRPDRVPQTGLTTAERRYNRRANILSRSTVVKLARLAGIKRISSGCDMTTRTLLAIHLKNTLRNTLAFTQHAKRTTVSITDVQRGLAREGKGVLHFENQERKFRSKHAIPKRVFQDLVRTLSNEEAKGYGLIRWQSTAIAALQYQSEDYLIQFLHFSNNLAKFAKRKTVYPKDMNFIYSVQNNQLDIEGFSKATRKVTRVPVPARIEVDATGPAQPPQELKRPPASDKKATSKYIADMKAANVEKKRLLLSQDFKLLVGKLKKKYPKVLGNLNISDQLNFKTVSRDEFLAKWWLVRGEVQRRLPDEDANDLLEKILSEGKRNAVILDFFEKVDAPER